MIQTLLKQAKVVGDVENIDASMQDYVQKQEFFVVRYPRSWYTGQWDKDQREVAFSAKCGAEVGCPKFMISVFDLTEGKGSQQYAEDMGRSLDLQPEYRVVDTSTISINDQAVGVVEYLVDQSEKGELKTNHHIEYIFVGQDNRYHINFSAPEDQFEPNRDLFAEISRLFTYLKSSPL